MLKYTTFSIVNGAILTSFRHDIFETDELFYFATSTGRELYFHFPGPSFLHQISIKISCNFRHFFFLSQKPSFVTILALLGA